MTVGQRLRFEILKRDGFRCRYCGTTAVAEPLVVDHVVPVAEGGTDEPSNLVCACWSCNSGKSAVPLDDLRIKPSIPREAMLEQVEHVRAYLDAQRQLDARRNEVAEYLADVWREQTFLEVTNELFNRLVVLASELPLEAIVDAIRATGAAVGHRVRTNREAIRYFNGCIRRRRGF